MSATILGKLLKKLRSEHNERLEQMAEKLGVTPSFLSALGSGRRALTPKLFDKLKKSYRLNSRRAEQIAMAAALCRDQLKIPYKDLTDIQRQLCAIFAANIRSADLKVIAKCYAALGISPDELLKWPRLLKLNEEDYKPFQQIIAIMRRAEKNRDARRKLLADLRAENLPELKETVKNAQADFEALKSEAAPKKRLTALQNSLDSLNEKIERLSGRLELRSLRTENAAEPPAEETDDSGPGQETLDL
ncbi:helix-turn-helix transcriptional regulator [bacterium]|nr:helix-turn-helix transcriptional regulator [bacterium]